MLPIPAIDLLDGKIVRLKKGDYNEVTVYHEDPLAFARQIGYDEGITRLHIVDLNGAKEGRFVNLELVSEIAAGTPLEVQMGGGIRRLDDISELLNAGVQRVVSSSMAVRRPDEWLQALDEFGPEHCIFGMDLKEGRVAVGGWLETDDQP
ncbi:MAG: HisA/HisF-related TIM barrel protein, partial [Cyclonatronaceae bacterium]